MPTTKLYVGNLSDNLAKPDLEALFSEHGHVTECAVLGNYGFVHFDDEEAAKAAVAALNATNFLGRTLKVEVSRSVQRGGGRGKSTKIFVGDLPTGMSKSDLNSLFDSYGIIVECDVIKNYGFVHFATEEQAQLACKVNGTNCQGNTLRVEVSNSKMRQKPGMGGRDGCFKCGRFGHWGKDCPSDSRGVGRGARGGRDDPYGRPAYSRDPYGSAYRDPYDDYYRDPYAHPPHPSDRYRPYDGPYDRRPPVSREGYGRESMYYRGRERESYGRPPPEYYSRRPASSSHGYSSRYDEDFTADSFDRGVGSERMSALESRVPGPY